MTKKRDPLKTENRKIILKNTLRCDYIGTCGFKKRYLVSVKDFVTGARNTGFSNTD